MNKHLIAYSIFTVSIVILLGFSSSSKNESQILDLQKTGNELAKVNADNKNLILEYQQKLAEKDKLITQLRSELAEQKKRLKQKTKPEVKEDSEKDKQKNFLSSILKASMDQQDNEQVKKFRKKAILKRYKELFKKLNLSEEDQEHLVNLLIERDRENQLQVAELLSGGTDQAIDPKAFSKDNLSSEKEISEFLGHDYDNFQKYEKTENERSLVKQIDMGLSEENQLTDDQKDKLIDLYAERNKSRLKGDHDDQEYSDKAAEFLNPQQAEEVNKSFKRNKSGFNIPFNTSNIIHFEVN